MRVHCEDTLKFPDGSILLKGIGIRLPMESRNGREVLETRIERNKHKIIISELMSILESYPCLSALRTH